MSDLLARITIDPNVLHGRPCIRGIRISVADVLAQLSTGASRDDILRGPRLRRASIGSPEHRNKAAGSISASTLLRSAVGSPHERSDMQRGYEEPDVVCAYWGCVSW